jgi:hypothetical protein
MIRIFFAFLLSITIGASASAQTWYTLISPKPASDIGCWEKKFPKFDTIIGYSNLGHFFMRASTNNEYMVIHPFKKAAKSYGVFKAVSDFENSVLKEAGFSEYVLRPEHVSTIRKRLGLLKKDEIYIPKPYPFLGGSDKPETYSKGDVWVFMDIVAQMHELCD